MDIEGRDNKSQAYIVYIVIKTILWKPCVNPVCTTWQNPTDMESSPVTVPVVRTSIVTLVQEISIHMARVLTFPVVHSEETWSTWLTQHWLCICSLNPLLLFYDMNVSRRHRLELVFSISVHFLPETPVFYGSGDDWDAWNALLGFFSHPLWN